MHASRPVRALVCLLLLASALVALSGSAIATTASPAGLRAQGPRVDERIAAKGNRHDRLRHKQQKHRKARHRRKAKVQAGATETAPRGEASPAPRLDEAVPTPGSGRNGEVKVKPDSDSRPAPPGAGTTTPPLGEPGDPAPSEPSEPSAPSEPANPSPPTPPTPPVPTSGCFSVPSRCGYPDPTNTGVPAGTTLTPSGSLVIRQAGTVVSGVDVTGTIQVLADDVTIENSRVTQTSTCGPTNSCGNYAIKVEAGLTGVRIAHVETATAPAATCQQDIRNTGSSLTIEAAYLHACDGNVYAAGPTVLKDSYGIAKIVISTNHIENIYFNETSFTAIHDTLLNPVNQTAVIFGNSGGGRDVTNCSNQLTIQESLLAGGGYSLYPCAHSAQPGSSTLNVIDNHFARCLTTSIYEANGGHHPCSGGFDANGYYPASGSYGIASDYYLGTGTWRGNVWDDNLRKVCIDGRSSGCE